MNVYRVRRFVWRLALAAWMIAGPMPGFSSAQEAIAKTGSSFEVASVKLSPPGGDGMFSLSPDGSAEFRVKNAPLSFLIGYAYDVDDYQIAGKPKWYGTQTYDVSARAAGDGGLSKEQRKLMLQQLLAERFHLTFHHETKEFKGYALLVAKGGPKLQPVQADRGGSLNMANILPNGLRAPVADMGFFAALLSRPIGRPVVDKTGLAGKYSIRLDYAPLGSTDTSLPSVFTALQEQLGLRAEPQQVPVKVMVIDHVDRQPTED